MVSKLNIFYQNARGLRTKTSCFKRNIALNNYDVISITETWLLEGIHNEELFDDRYMVWRRDRDYSLTNQSLGGGVLIGIRREFAAVSRPEWSSTSEDLWVTIILNSPNEPSLKIHLCTIYLCRQNLGNTSTVQLENFTHTLFDIVNSCSGDIFIILGDFNLPRIDWDPQGNLEACELPLSKAQTNFTDTLLQCDLTQRNHVRNDNNRFLDLVFSNCELEITACPDPLVPDDIPHHKSLNIALPLNQNSPLQNKTRTKYFYNSGDYDLITKNLFEINWTESFCNKSLDEALKYFYDTLYELRDSYIPKKLIRPNSYPPWYSSALIKVLREKHKFFRKYKLYGNQSDYSTFSLLRKRAKSLEKTCYDAYINKVQESITCDPRAFWSFIKSNKKSTTYPSSMTLENVTASVGDQICDLFATHFHANFLQPCPRSIVTPPDVNQINNNNVNIGSININTEELLKLLENVNLNKGAGPDDIPPIFIKNCATSLVAPLSILFERSLNEGHLPNIWKSAFITPVYKSGDKTNIKNYRPISKLCIFSKIFERIVYNQVYTELQNWFIPEQHGFLRGRSTTSNLLLTYDFVSSSMDSGCQVDIIYTDFSKAFDRIDHSILLEKLHKAGIHGNLFRWFSSYINNRSQAVALNGYISSWMSVPSGVPQGSLLGPLLFAIFLNDVSSCFLHSRFYLYADDTKIIKRITSSIDVQLLQEDLYRFCEYCLSNKLDLNVSKCFVVNFTRKLHTIKHDYTLNNQPLSHKNSIKDLGVIVDSKLLFDEHIAHAVKKASKALGFIIRSCKDFRALKPIKVLYCSYVRSILEYCSEVWNPIYHTYIYRIESIQKKFLRYLQYKCGDNLIDYEARCMKYHFLPLQYRRKVSDLVYLSKIINNLIDSPELHNKISINVPTRFFRTFLPFHIPPCNTNYRRNSFICRSSAHFNHLVRAHSNIDAFSFKPSHIKLLANKNFFSAE